MKNFYFFQRNSVEKSKQAIFLVPGMRAGVQSGKFENLIKACNERGYDVVAFQSWENAEMLGKKTLRDVLEEIAAVLENIKSIGYEKIGAIGKSFGAMLLLLAKQDLFSSIVLWSPGAGIEDDTGNISEIENLKLDSIPSILDIKIGTNSLENQKTSVLIYHGTLDEVVPFSQSEKIARLIPGAGLRMLPGEKHSYSAEIADTVIRESLDFIEKNFNLKT